MLSAGDYTPVQHSKHVDFSKWVMPFLGPKLHSVNRTNTCIYKLYMCDYHTPMHLYIYPHICTSTMCPYVHPCICTCRWAVQCMATHTSTHYMSTYTSILPVTHLYIHSHVHTFTHTSAHPPTCLYKPYISMATHASTHPPMHPHNHPCICTCTVGEGLHGGKGWLISSHFLPGDLQLKLGVVVYESTCCWLPQLLLSRIFFCFVSFSISNDAVYTSFMDELNFLR